MNSGICNLSVIPLRTEPADKSEMVSQLLFGETFEVLEKNKQWLRIRTHADDYSGWIDAKQIKLISTEFLKKTLQPPQTILLDPTAVAYSNKGSLLLLAGSSLPNYSENKFYIADEEYKIEADTIETGVKDLTSRIPWFALKFAGAPYLWGGRSLFGMDCSGFTGVVFKMAGIQLRRDAWQQSEQGILVSFIDVARAGDLAFFHNEENKITHVGIILEGKKIIHASGSVHIDTVDHFGIYNEEQKRYTHQLRFVKRML
ncbi:MAG: C40 family peptidase [Chitinophagales bacterium]|nr:C40 family peptidase [Chitinophagales bacterium]